jgi:hypothetical protein
MYHGWRYGLKGDLTFVQQESEFMGLDKADYGLAGVRCEVWEGFVFVNLDPDAAPLSDYMGRLGTGLEGYPFGRLTQKHTYRAEIGANWKLFIDAFMDGVPSQPRAPAMTTAGSAGVTTRPRCWHRLGSGSGSPCPGRGCAGSRGS